MSIFPLIMLGLLPSFVWLLFYLRKDVHPESNRMVLKIFFYGMLIVLPAVLVEVGVESGLCHLSGLGAQILEVCDRNLPFIFIFLNLLAIAFTEEFLKYLVVREKVLKNPEFDEPVDVMLYMIIAALGFAALENIGFLLSAKGISETIAMAFGRFLSATFLHALCSGILGFFLAISFYESKNRSRLFVAGLTTAVALHTIYNILIIKMIDNTAFLIAIVALLGTMAIVVSLSFKKLKKIASVCKIANSEGALKI